MSDAVARGPLLAGVCVVVAQAIPPLKLFGAQGGTRYDISCTVSKPGRSPATATGFLEFRPANLPVVVVDTRLAASPVNPSGRIVLSGNVTSDTPRSLSIAWSQGAGPPVNMSDLQQVRSDDPTSLT